MAAIAVLSKRKRDLRNELAILEKQIFDLETTYLEETRESGNVFSGWAHLHDPERVRTKRAPTNEEKHFSLSSVTSPAFRLVMRKEDNSKRRETTGGGVSTGVATDGEGAAHLDPDPAADAMEAAEPNDQLLGLRIEDAQGLQGMEDAASATAE